MYYPIQIPYILSKAFAESIRYTEELVPALQDFMICLWEMQPASELKTTADNIIVADGCIDLVVDYYKRQIAYCGMSKTEYNSKINLPAYLFGARFKPGAFYTLTNIHATEAMDTFVQINEIDMNFDVDAFFRLSFNEAKIFFKDYLSTLIHGKKPDWFTSFFDKLSNNIPDSVSEIYRILNYSPMQCQRLFKKHFGLTPQMALCIIRFQKCLEIMTSGNVGSNDVLSVLNFHDQAHLIKDFKKNIGLTPLELVKKYTKW
jgi:AraC-like DNA-binding protein